MEMETSWGQTAGLAAQPASPSPLRAACLTHEPAPRGHGAVLPPVGGGLTDVTKCDATDCARAHNARGLGYGSPGSTGHVSQHLMDTSTVMASTQVLLSTGTELGPSLTRKFGAVAR